MLAPWRPRRSCCAPHALKEACANFFASVLRNYTLDLYWPTQGTCTNDEGRDRTTPWDGREFDRQMFLSTTYQELAEAKGRLRQRQRPPLLLLLLRRHSPISSSARRPESVAAPRRQWQPSPRSSTRTWRQSSSTTSSHTAWMGSSVGQIRCCAPTTAFSAISGGGASYPQNLPWPRPGGFDAATSAFPAELQYDAVGGVDDDVDGGLSCASVLGHHSTLARPRQLRDAQELVMEMESMEQKNTLTRRRSSVSGRPERVIASPGALSTSSSRGWLGLWSVKKKGGGRAKAKAKGRAKLAGVSRGKCKAESIEGDVPSERSLSTSQRSSFKEAPPLRHPCPASVALQWRVTHRGPYRRLALLTGDNCGIEMSDATAAAARAGADSGANAGAGPVLTRLVEGVLDEGAQKHSMLAR